MSVEDDAVVTAVVPDAETPAAETPAGEDDENDFGTAEQIAPDRWRWSKDGVITNEAGEVVEDEEDPTPPAPTAAVTPKPAEPAAKPRTETPAVTTPTNPDPIFTAQNVQDAIYTEAVKQEMSELLTSDYNRYVQRNFELQQTHAAAMQNLHNHASQKFNSQLSALKKEQPEAFELFGSQLESARLGLSKEQQQMPGIARQLLANIMGQEFAADPDLMREAAMRAMPGRAPAAPTVSAKPATPPPVRVAPVVNRAANMPGPGTARKPASGGGPDAPRRINPRIVHIMKQYGVTEEEAKKMDYDLQHMGGR